MSSSPSPTAASTGTGRRTTNRAHRSANGARAPGAGSPSVSSAARPLRPSTRRPVNPSSAGSSVSATSTATTTVLAAPRPIAVRNGMLTTNRPARAMTTVRPAKTTALPAVATARPAASSPSRPLSSSCRNLEVMNSA